LNDYEGIAGFEEFRGDLSLMYFADVDAADGRLRALDMTPLKIRRLQLSRPPARTSIGCGGRSIAKARRSGRASCLRLAGDSRLGIQVNKTRVAPKNGDRGLFTHRPDSPRELLCEANVGRGAHNFFSAASTSQANRGISTFC